MVTYSYKKKTAPTQLKLVSSNPLTYEVPYEHSEEKPKENLGTGGSFALGLLFGGVAGVVGSMFLGQALANSITGTPNFQSSFANMTFVSSGGYGLKAGNNGNAIFSWAPSGTAQGAGGGQVYVVVADNNVAQLFVMFSVTGTSVSVNIINTTGSTVSGTVLGQSYSVNENSNTIVVGSMG